jgi:hypothetical protein
MLISSAVFVPFEGSQILQLHGNGMCTEMATFRLKYRPVT